MNEEDEDDFADDFIPEWPPQNACVACVGDGWRMELRDGKFGPITCTVCDGRGRCEETPA